LLDEDLSSIENEETYFDLHLQKQIYGDLSIIGHWESWAGGHFRCIHKHFQTTI